MKEKMPLYPPLECSTWASSALVPLSSAGGVFCHSQENSWAQTGKILLPAVTALLQMSDGVAPCLLPYWPGDVPESIGLQMVNESCAFTVTARNLNWDKWPLLPPSLLLKTTKKLNENRTLDCPLSLTWTRQNFWDASKTTWLLTGVGK